MSKEQLETQCTQTKSITKTVADYIGTPYDDVFRTLLERCSKLIIPVINEIFKTDYSMDEEITLISNEHYIIEGDGDTVKRITDSCIKVAKRLYHIECESNPQTGMEIRMMEYDFHIALSGWRREGDIAVLRFPESAVLFLRHNSNSPDELKVKLIMPDGKEVFYTVPVVKVQEYTKEEIFDKKLLFFIPYYIMRFEKDIKRIDEEEAELQKIKLEYEDIYNRLCNLENNKEIDYVYLHNLISLMAKLINIVAKDASNVKREVITVGGGRVLELESDRILQRGITQGVSLGELKNAMESVVELLEDYGVVSDELKDKIYSQKDISKLKVWLKIAAKVSSIEEFVERM